MRIRILPLVIAFFSLYTVCAWAQANNRFRNMPPFSEVVTSDTFVVEYEIKSAPATPNIFLDGSGSDTKEVVGQNFRQDMTYSLEVSFNFKASNPTIVNDIIHYDLTNIGGRVHFFGQAIDIFNGQTTILNFNHTFDYLNGTGNGTLTYSKRFERVEAIDFSLPLGFPDKFRPSRLRFNASSKSLRVDILNFSFWMFDEDYWIPATSNRCAQSDPCLKPKALLIAGHGNLPDNEELFEAAAADLWEKGWLPLIPPAPTYEDIIEQINNDSCIRGLYIDAHGTSNGSIVIGRRGNPAPLRVLPSDIAANIPDSQLDFVTIFACYVRKFAWQAAFPQSRVITSRETIKDKYGNEYSYGPYDVRDQKFHDHGTPLDACDQYGLPANPGLNNRISTSQDECASFAICDSSSCGEDIFPVTSCVDSVGVPIASMFSVAPPDSMFSVTVHLPANNSDSVGCAASYFTDIPGRLMHPTLLPLGRFLVFADVEKDSSLASDSLSVTMKYFDSDLIQAGITDETKLVAYWTSADSVQLQQMTANLDTALNSITLNVPRWGLVGIYGSNEVTDINERNPANTTFQLYQNYPNPFNPFTTISFTLPERGHVRLKVFDINGKLVRTLIDGVVERGDKEVTWNGKNSNGRAVVSGTYFYQLRVGKQVISKKAVLLR